jgi:hypothetical protein
MKSSLLFLVLPLCAAAGPCHPGRVNIGSLDHTDSGHPQGGLGAACDVGGTPTPEQAALDSHAPECATGLCIKPASATPVSTGALCTAGCRSADDCQAGEAGGDGKCTSGFVCAVPFEVGPLACKRLCVCNDFLRLPTGATPPSPPSCGSTRLICEWDVATQAYDRNCIFATGDASVPDGSRLIVADPSDGSAP